MRALSFFPRRTRLVGIVNPPEKKGVDASAATERGSFRAAVGLRTLAFSLPRVVPHESNIQRSRLEFRAL
jgi:hypothetical protein